MLQKIFLTWRTFFTRLFLSIILIHDHGTFEKIPLSKHQRANSYMWIMSNFMLYFVVDLKSWFAINVSLQTTQSFMSLKTLKSKKIQFVCLVWLSAQIICLKMKQKRFRENNKLWLCWQFVKANNIMWIKLNGKVPSHSLASSLPFVNKLNILSFGQLPFT